MNPDAGFWAGRRVLVTGHTGFKGAWLSLWLESMGAELHGFSLAPPTHPSLYETASVSQALASTTVADIRERDTLALLIQKSRPEIVFHLAAQPLVRESYRNPVDTYEVNVLGVVYMLEAVRACSGVRAVVNVTSDKCYRNEERRQGYREEESLGGRDPYSSSKACAELVTAAYRESFFADAGVGVSTARAGNVIGGGDWSHDRLVPDVFRSLESGIPLVVRFPDARRPWQHVLDPLAGYLLLAERLFQCGGDYAEAWNFGPSGDHSVGWVVECLAKNHPQLKWETGASEQPHEAQYLKLDSSKARSRLGWEPRWDLTRAVDRISEWHAAWTEGRDMRACSLAQIREYVGS